MKKIISSGSRKLGLLFLLLVAFATNSTFAQEPGNCNIMSTLPSRGCIGTVNVYSAAMNPASNGQTLLWTIPVNQTGAFFTDAVIGGANLGTSITTIAHSTVDDEPNNVLVNVGGVAGSLTVQMFIQGQGNVGGCNSSRVVRDVDVTATAPVLRCPTDLTTITAVALTRSAFNGPFLPNANGYEYTLSPGAIVNNTGVFTGVGAGPYTILAREILTLSPLTYGCSAATTITVAPVTPNPLIANCPVEVDRPACTSQADLEVIFQQWLLTFGSTGGFPPVITTTDPSGVLHAPNHCGGSVTITWTVTDSCNQTDSCTRTFLVRNSLPPTLVCPPGGPLGCNPETIPAPTAPTITSACPTLPYTSVDVITGPMCAQVLTRTYTVTNECGQSATCDQVFTYKIDHVAPVLHNVPTGGYLGCNPTNLPACDPLVNATDNCDEFPVATCTPGAITGEPCARTQTITYASTDSCGNTVSVPVIYTWKEDHIAPVISNLPSGGALGCNPTRPTCSTTVTANDNCDGTVAVTCSAGEVTGQPCALTQIFTYSATDACGNTISTPVTYTWKEDRTAPVLVCVGNKDVACNATVIFDAPSATDNCTATANIIITAGDEVVVSNPDGSVSHTKSWTATDECGNISTACSQTVRVLSCATGCTLGYWKNHTDRWCSDYKTCTLYKDVFTGSTLPANLTLLQALNLGGGDCNNLARQSVAALLNICNGMPFSIGTIADLKTQVNAAFAGGTCGALGSKLDGFNSLGAGTALGHCPLGGSSATVLPSVGCPGGATPKIGSTAKGDNATGNVARTTFTAYPNPFGSSFSVNSGDTTNPINVNIFDVLGRNVETRTVTPAEFDSPILGRDYPTGVYNVIFDQATEQKTLRMIKQ